MPDQLSDMPLPVPGLPESIASFPPHVLCRLKDLGLLPQCLRAAIAAADVASIEISDSDKSQLLSQYCQEKRIANQEMLEAHLKVKNSTLDSLTRELLLSLQIKRCAQQRYGAKAEAEFLDCKERLDRVVYSLLRVRDPELAQELYLRLEQRESTFPELAEEFSEGPERQTQGIIGPVPLTQAHPVLVEKLRTHQSGQLIPPFSIEQWWLVVRLDRYTPAEFTPATALEMAQKLYNDSLNEEVLRQLRAIQIYLDSTEAA